MHEVNAPPHPKRAKGPDLSGTSVGWGQDTQQTGANSMQYANASWGDTPANAHLSRGNQEPRLPTGPRSQEKQKD